MANRDLTLEERNTLENLIDCTSIQAVLEALSDICGEKAEHIRSNWADIALAKQWDTACGLVGFLSTAPAIAAVSQ